MSLLIFTVSVVVFLALVTCRFSRAMEDSEYCRYEKKRALFTVDEKSFLEGLEQAGGGNFRIMGKVRLDDIVAVRRNKNKVRLQAAYDGLRGRRADFVICNAESFAVQSVIVLDGARYLSDPFWDKVSKAVGTPVFHFSPSVCASPGQFQAVFSGPQAVMSLQANNVYEAHKEVFE
jgi:Protein of unknown function (DUF2726)